MSTDELHPSLRGARACVFDAGGTLVHPDWERLAALAKKQTVTLLYGAKDTKQNHALVLADWLRHL